MTRTRTARTSAAWLAPWLIAIALLLRIAVPAGWMPAENGFGIVPCAGSGPLQLAAASQHGAHAHHGEKREEGQAQPCAFAPFATALAAPPAPPPLLAPLPVAAPLRPLLTSAATIGRRLAAPPPPATGPPASS